MKKFILLFILTAFTSNINAQNTIANSDLFDDGPTLWPRIFIAAAPNDNNNGAAQTLVINITSLPAAGVNYRVYSTDAANGPVFSEVTALTLGSNTLSIAAVTWSRAVKFQFKSGDVGFDALTFNGVDLLYVNTDATIESSNLFDSTNNTSWPRILIAAATNDNNNGAAQVLKINITELPEGGANHRIYSTDATNTTVFSNVTALTLGMNTISLAAVTYNRAVKFQFSSGDVYFDEVSLNNDADDEDVATSSLFDDTSSATWLRKLDATTTADQNGGAAQTLAITITKLPTTGANYRVYKTNSSGGDYFSPASPLKLGVKIITVGAVTFNRAVKFQFDSGDIEYSSITINNSIFWDGSTDTSWETASNWSTNELPTAAASIIVGDGMPNYPTVNSDASIASITLSSASSLTVDQTSSLTVSGDLTNNSGTVTLNSTADAFSSLIVEGTATGDITYNRYVNVYDDGNSGGWDLVGSPTVMTVADFIIANGANIEVLGDNYAFAQYNNASGQWERYATALQDGSFTSGQGYSMATATNDSAPPPPAGGNVGYTVAFTGAMQTADETINVINNNGLNGVGRRWNLVSNPFPSYINGNTAAEAGNNFMDVNSGVIDGSFLGVYGWNGSSYTTYNNTSDAFSIAPGQGFWVAALNITNTPLDFTTAMRTTTGTGDFVAGPQPLVYKLELKLFNGETQKSATKFYFRDGLSLGLDPGYDAGAFNQSTKLSTRLPQGSQEFAFEINAMGIDALQNTRVPLEIRQNAGQEFTISVADMDLPQDIYVYLEDTLNGTLTSLKEQDFELTAQSDISGVDRFFIVFKSNSVLSNGDTLGINALNIYKANTDSFITIAGITPDIGLLDVTLYSMLGQTVHQEILNTATATQRVSTGGLTSGLYIVQIKSGNQTTVKKIIVK